MEQIIHGRMLLLDCTNITLGSFVWIDKSLSPLRKLCQQFNEFQHGSTSHSDVKLIIYKGLYMSWLKCMFFNIILVDHMMHFKVFQEGLFHKLDNDKSIVTSWMTDQLQKYCQ